MQQPFKKLKIHQPSLPQTVQTPEPERSKVVSTPTRLPINRQAALTVRQTRSWIEEPPPEKPRVISFNEYARAQADLKIERNSHAITRDELGRARAQIKELKEMLDHKQCVIEGFQKERLELKETIRQLEDIKL